MENLRFERTSLQIEILHSVITSQWEIPVTTKYLLADVNFEPVSTRITVVGAFDENGASFEQMRWPAFVNPISDDP